MTQLVECCRACTKSCIVSPALHNPDEVVDVCDPSTCGWREEDQKFKINCVVSARPASLEYMRLWKDRKGERKERKGEGEKLRKISFIIVPKRVRYLRNKLTKGLKDKRTENFKALMEETE